MTVRRLITALTCWALTLAVVAPAALAHDGGEGWWGETNDKVITNAGFIVIAFFPLFIFVMSLLQWWLEKRKKGRQLTATQREERERLRGGW